MIKYVGYKIAKAQISGLLYTIGETKKKNQWNYDVTKHGSFRLVPFARFCLLPYFDA